MLNAVIHNDLIMSVAALSALSGVGGFFHGVRSGRNKPSVIDFLSELFVAQTVGLAVCYLMLSCNASEPLICGVVLVASNDGSEKLALMNAIVKTRLKQILGKVFGVQPEGKKND